MNVIHWKLWNAFNAMHVLQWIQCNQCSGNKCNVKNVMNVFQSIFCLTHSMIMLLIDIDNWAQSCDFSSIYMHLKGDISVKYWQHILLNFVPSVSVRKGTGFHK